MNGHKNKTRGDHIGIQVKPIAFAKKANVAPALSWPTQAILLAMSPGEPIMPQQGQIARFPK